MNGPSGCRLMNRRILFQSLSTIRAGSTNLFYSSRVAQRAVQFQRRQFASRYGSSKPSAESRGPQRNPFDTIYIDAATAEQRAKDIRYMRFCALGLMCTIGATFITTQIYPPPPPPPKKTEAEKGKEPSSKGILPRSSMDTLDKEGADEFQGKPVVVIAGGQRVVARDRITGQDVELVNTGTSTIPHFPKTIKLPSSAATGSFADGLIDDQENEYTLLGLGIRTVSLFSIQVYVVGMYVQTSSLPALQARMVKYINPQGSALVAGEKDELKQALLDGDKSYALWDELLGENDLGLKTAFRVVPVRNTDFGHLRDGWVRGITSRTQLAQKNGDARFSDESFGLAMRAFKDLMAGKGKAPTGSVLLLTRDTDGSMGLLFQNKDSKVEDFGGLKDERIARLVWLGYLGGKNVSSEGARKAIVDGVMELVERPIGSVETRVG